MSNTIPQRPGRIVFENEDETFVLFSGNKDPFSQFYPVLFETTVTYTPEGSSKGDEREWSTIVDSSEMAMMWAKAKVFGDARSARAILAATSPAQCKKLGRGVIGYDEAIWGKVAPNIVAVNNYYKFSSSEEMMKEILVTGDATIVEASSWDKKWGSGLTPAKTQEYIIENGKVPGKNLLGKAIMKARKWIAADMHEATKK